VFLTVLSSLTLCVSDGVVVTYIVEVGGQVVAGLLQLWKAAGSGLLVGFLLEATPRGALLRRPLLLGLRVALRFHLLLQRRASASPRTLSWRTSFI